METWFHDFRYGPRVMLKNPGFTALAALTLALSIGANTAMFSVVYGVLLRPLSYPPSNRIMDISWMTTGGQENPGVTGPQVDFLKRRNGPFESLAGMSYSGYVNFGNARSVHTGRMQLVSRDYFRVLGIAPSLGRSFTPEEDRAGGPAPSSSATRFGKAPSEEKRRCSAASCGSADALTPSSA